MQRQTTFGIGAQMSDCQESRRLSVHAATFAGLVELRKLRCVFMHPHGWTDFVLIAGLADNPDHVRARHFQLMRFTQVVELFQVSADHVKLGCQGVVFWFRSVLKTCRSRLVALLPTPWHSRNEYADCATKADSNWQIGILESSEGTGCHGW